MIGDGERLMNRSVLRRRAVSAARVVILGAAAATTVPVAHGEEPAVAPLQRAGCQLIKIAEWTVLPGVAQPVVEGRINGKTVGMLLDTGASRTALTRSMAIRLGLAREATRQHAYGIGGTSAVETTVADVEIGDASRKSWPMIVVGDRDFGRIGVILGGDFFRLVDVEFDLAHDAVRLFQAKDCSGVSLAYWASGGAGQVAIDSYESEPIIALRIEINGHALDGQLDSGAERSLLNLWNAATLGVQRSSPGVVSAGCLAGVGREPMPVWYGPFDTFVIGDERIRNPSLHFADIHASYPYRASYRPDMLLGADFLRAHRVMVAHSQRRMYFTYVEGTVFRAGPAGKCPADAQPPR